ncbi:MAG: FAD-dependent oxidoreductase [Melioribacteraceae bacterium]|nr:FAD-dependent oxidoreductase [Melioribacteraceae bacterium]
MYNPRKILIIGGNAAGPAAAAKAKRVNPDAEVTLFEGSKYISTGTCEIPYVLSGEIENYNDIIFYDKEKFEAEKGVKVYTNHFVNSINRKEKKIKVRNLISDDEIFYEYDSLILCTGSVPRQIQEIPFSIENVFPLKFVSDLQRLLGFISKNNPKTCLIIGSGYIGLEAASALRKRGLSVKLGEKFSNPFPGSEPEIQEIIKDRLSSLQIEFIPGIESLKYIIKNNKVVQYKHEGRLIEIDLIIVSAGIMPNTVLAQMSKLDLGLHNGIVVNNKLQTSDPNLYAAGDNIIIKNFITSKEDYMPVASIAHSFGHIAGANAAGSSQIYKPVIKNIAVEFLELAYSQAGLTLDEAVNYFPQAVSATALALNKAQVMPNSSKTFGKLIYDKSSGYILGASFIGKNEVTGYADIVSSLIQNRVKAFSLDDLYFNYTPPLSPFVNLLSILGRKIRRNN